jgi:apolipoprotein N-acyltransferase
MGEKNSSSNLWFLNSFTYNAPAHQPKMQNYVALYGFLRTLTFLSILSFWLIFASWLGGKLDFVYSICLLASTAFVSLILFLGFVKFYRRFSLEVLMALSVIFNSKIKVSIKKNTIRQKISPKH